MRFMSSVKMIRLGTDCHKQVMKVERRDGLTQCFSSFHWMGCGAGEIKQFILWFLSDNIFGSKASSSFDGHLMFPFLISIAILISIFPIKCFQFSFCVSIFRFCMSVTFFFFFYLFILRLIILIIAHSVKE